MGTLYIVGAPAGDPEDITPRALRLLGEVVLVVADDVDHAQRLLARHGLDTPLLAATNADLPLRALDGGDVHAFGDAEKELMLAKVKGYSDAELRVLALAYSEDFEGSQVDDGRAGLARIPQTDGKLTDASGRTCIVRNVAVKAGDIFSIEEKDLTSCE